MTNKDFSFGAAFGSGWARLKEHWLFFVIAYTAIFVVSGVFGALAEGPYKDIEPTSGLLDLIGLILRIWLNFNLLVVTIRMFDDVKPDWRDLFIWREETLSYAGASILYGLIVFLGCLVFLIPGIYFAVKYSFFGFLIADKKMGAFDALKVSGQLTDGAKWLLVGFGFASLGVIILGTLALGIGLFVALPVISIALVFVYRSLYAQTFDLIPGPAEAPTVPPVAPIPASVTDDSSVETNVSDVLVTPAPKTPDKPEPPVMTK